MRLRSGSPPAAGLALLLSAFAAACDYGDRGATEVRAGPPGVGESRCEVGAERGGAGVPGEERGIVLGCGRTRAGEALLLYSFGDAGGPCLNIAGLPGGTRACGRAPSEREPPARGAIAGGAIVRRPGRAALELYGETGPNVRRVVLRYRLPHRRPGERPATLICVRDRAALRAAGIRRPFGYFVGRVPRRARQVAAYALGGSGEQLGRLRLDGLARSMHPTVFIAVEE